MENKSIWQYGIKSLKYNKLDKDIRCDVLIIGGGIAGLSCAYFLKNSKYKTVLVDKNMCGMGISARSTGKLTFMQDLIYNKIKDNYDEDKALMYLNSQKDAVKIVRDIIIKNNIACNYDKTPSYVFTSDIKKLENFKKEIVFYDDNNIRYKVKNSIPLDYPCLYSLRVNYGGVFHPLKYLMALRSIVSKDIDVYEDTTIVKLYKRNGGYVVHTDDNHIIKATYVVVCTHYPFFIVPFFLPFKSSVEKSYLICGESESNKGIQLISNENVSISIRYHTDKGKNYIIYGRCSHVVCNHLDTRKQYKELIDEYKKYFKGKIKCYWLNHDIMSYDCIPYIGRINNSNLLVACGFNKWGNTNGTIAGKVIYDIIMGRGNPYIELFNPCRSLSWNNFKNLVIYNFNTMSRYILNKLSPSMGYYEDDVKIEMIDGKLCGIYTDKDKKRHIVSNICPHMKCNLIFNYKDKTWDCPCHGSRFDIDGNVMFGPAVYDIKIDKKETSD